MSGKRYFPNNWEEYANTPDKDFIPHTFAEVMHWKIGGWELPSSVCCIIRAMDKDTRKVKEYVYSRPSYAQRALINLTKNPNTEVTICDAEAIGVIRADDQYQGLD